MQLTFTSLAFGASKDAPEIQPTRLRPVRQPEGLLTQLALGSRFKPLPKVTAMTFVSFSFENSAVRTLGTPDAPLFVALDICNALQHSNPWKAVKDLCDAEDVSKQEIVDAKGRKQTVNCVNESGLYALIFGSKLESAKRFKRWVTSEVLPAIRKTGRYEAPKTITPAQQFAIRAAVDKAAHANSLTYQAIYKALYAKYSIPRYTELLQTDFDDALAFIQECAPKKKTKALPVQPGTELTPKELEDLMNVLYQLRYFFRPELKAFHRFLELSHSPHAARFYEAYTSTAFGKLERILAAHGYDVRDMPQFQYLRPYD